MSLVSGFPGAMSQRVNIQSLKVIFLVPVVYVSADASGAACAAGRGHIVMIVDVIDLSTTCEAVLDEGALAIYGAAPDDAHPPVPVDPFKVGQLAGRHACAGNSGVIIVAEPRAGSDRERLSRIAKVCRGIRESGATIEAVLPNLGAETVKLAAFGGRVVVAATDAGGVAFDAALTAGAPAVLTGTVARTLKKKGSACALAAARRACVAAEKLQTNLAVIAASANAIEDLLAAEYIFKLILGMIRDRTFLFSKPSG